MMRYGGDGGEMIDDGRVGKWNGDVCMMVEKP